MNSFASALRALMDERGLSVNALARQVPCDKALISRYRNGAQPPSLRMARRLDEVLNTGGQLVALVRIAEQAPTITGPDLGADDEIAALELIRRASVSDVGGATVERLERVVDDLAVAYPSSRPAVLLPRVRRHLGYVAGLMEARATLGERRRLLVVAGWLSLLAATCSIDLDLPDAAGAHLASAASMAREAEHPELAAWALETEAWRVLTTGDYRRAVELARAAQRVAPRGSSALVQATAQESRAWARLRDVRETVAALRRAEALAAAMPVPDRPEHHYRFDARKGQSYGATVLAWAGDPAAEGEARQVVAAMESPAEGAPRPRRAASARLDLALALAGAGRADEAAGTALAAVESRLLVPSNFWRAEEVIGAVAATAEPESRELAEAFRELYRPPAPRPQLG